MRTHIDYGIFFNSDFCQIARVENGIPVIKRSDTMKDSMPLCVSFNKRGDVHVGDTAYNVLRNDSSRALKSFEPNKTNSFIQFTRTLGTDHTYKSSNTGKSYSSQELLAECFKKLKSFIQDEEVKATAISVSAQFSHTQLQAVRSAAKFAGFEQIELIQEPIAALMGFGLNSNQNNGFYLLFDFQSDFNVSLCKLYEGIISIIDIAGDFYLGYGNIREAIVDDIIIPYLKENYKIDIILNNPKNKYVFRNAFRIYADEALARLNQNDSHNILSSLGDLPFEDESGNEPELDIELSRQDLAWISRPIYQKAIDITIDLLNKNRLKGKDLASICLVGEGTNSPILRSMLKEQITDKVDTSIDPMTVIAKGAALLASTMIVSDEVEGVTRGKTKLHLDIKYEATTVELDEMVNIKVLKEKTVGTFPEKIYVDVVRSDGTWSSGKKQIGEKASLVEVVLNQGQSNSFDVNIYDETGNKLECQPNQFSILQGTGGLNGMQVLPYHIGIAKYFESEGKELFLPVKGLEKNRSLPAIGVINGFKTKYDIIPGLSSDIIRIPIYQGDHNAEGTNLLLNNHVCDILISGETLPVLLPAGSDIDITIIVDTSHLITFTAYITYLNFTNELKIDIKQAHPISKNDIEKLKSELVLFYSENPAMGKERFRFLLGELIRIGEIEVGQDEKMKVVEIVKNELIKWK